MANHGQFLNYHYASLTIAMLARLPDCYANLTASSIDCRYARLTIVVLG